MTNRVRTILGMLWLGITVAGCQGVPGLFGPGSTPDGNSPFSGSNLIGNNAASLSGQLFAPKSLVANNSAALVGNNSAALVSNNAAAYRITALEELPVIKAEVEAVQGGQVVSKATTDDKGQYSLPNLSKEKAYLIRATFTLDGHKFQELGIGKPMSQQSGNTLNSASTLVAAKVVTHGTPLDQVNMAKYYDTMNLVAATQSSIDPSALTSTEQSAQAFDQISQSNDQVAASLQEAVSAPQTSPSPTPSPSATPNETTYAPKDYFYPPSATAKAQFQTTETVSDGQDSQVSTSSFSVKVTDFNATNATLQRTVGALTFDSILQVSGGIVNVGTQTDTGPSYTMNLGTPVFTTEGSIVSTFGADTVRYAMLAANEQVTVKAGTYSCVKLVETTTTDQGQTQRTLWYAKGIGLGPVKAINTTTQDGQTTTTETVLTSFQP